MMMTPPKQGDALPVRLRDGTIRAGECVSTAVWSPHRQSRGSGGSGDVLRRMTADDVAYLNTGVQPLAKEVLAMARRMVAERGLPIELVSASCFFDCCTVVLLMRRAAAAAHGPDWTHHHVKRQLRQTDDISRRIGDAVAPDHAALGRLLGKAAQPPAALQVLWNREQYVSHNRPIHPTLSTRP